MTRRTGNGVKRFRGELQTTDLAVSPLSLPKPDVPDDRLSSVLSGIALGVGFLALYLAAGLLFAGWSVAEFLDHLTAEIVLWLLVASAVVIAVVAVPVFLYRQYRFVSPIALLAVVLVGWVVAGLSIGAVFGLSLYVFGLAPLYLVLYVVLGVGERYLRNRPGREEQHPKNGGEER